MNNLIKYLKVNLSHNLNNSVKFLKNRLGHKTFLVVASLFVGVFSGLAAVLLKNLVHFFQREPKILFTQIGLQFLLPVSPLIGILLSVLLINVVFKGKFTRGLSNLIYLIVRKNSDVPRRKILSHLLTSAATVGMGGSAGLEAPIVLIGSSIGSNVAKDLKLNYKTRTLLLACGSAAGISAIFNSPIAGVIFAVEVLLPEITISSFIPLLIASASSAVLSKFLYSGQLFYLVTEGWHLYAIPYYIVLGILCGLISLYMIKSTFALEDWIGKFKKPYLKATVGGIILCALIFLLPPLYGEGYSTIVELLKGNQFGLIEGTHLNLFSDPNLSLLVVLALAILFKVIATSFTLGSGGNGGIIAPSLFTGAITGFFLAKLVSYLGIVELNHANFLVVGMAGILSGVLHAPLTGIFLIAEITGGYTLIVPLMIVAALSFFISKYFHPDSIYTTALARRGIKFRSEKEKYFIQQTNLEDLIEKDFECISPKQSLRELSKKIAQTKRNLFPVVNEEKSLVGIITLDDIREVMLNSEMYDIILAYEIMNTNFQSVEMNTDVNTVMEIFEKKQIWNLAVTNNGKYVGFISKSNIFNKFISVWAEQHHDDI
ncbi:MAG: chloride channel protein [Ignavibacteria bacterium]|nr:chloride channel protein [Ignavibacteria bacterium]